MYRYAPIYAYVNIYRNILYIMKLLSHKKKNNEIMLLAATWMGLIILREASQKEKTSVRWYHLLRGL